METEVFALILTGGLSTRMGIDKSLLTIHSKPQWQYLAECCNAAGIKVFISCRSDQEISKQTLYQVITDKYVSIGPMGGILSAFDYKPSAAWLIVACDLPGVDSNAIQSLLTNRNKTKKATVLSGINDSVEPLFSVLEPSLYNDLLSSYKQGYYSVKSVLEKNEIEKIQLTDAGKILQNINTPEDLKNYIHVK